MKTVNIGDLKANLSAHLRLVKSGEEVMICERNKPVARITPYYVDDYSKEMQSLIARGIVRPPLKKRPASLNLPKPSGKMIPDDVMQRVWDAEREDR